MDSKEVKGLMRRKMAVLKELALKHTSKEALNLAKLLKLELPVDSWLGILTVEEVDLDGTKVYVITRYYTIENKIYRQLLWVEGSVANITVNEALRKIESLTLGHSEILEELVKVSVDEDSL